MIHSMGVHHASPVILAVDDEPAILAQIAAALRNAEYLVITAENGTRALDAAEHAVRLDLLITDIRMPRCNGLRLATSLRRLWPDMRVLLLSGYIDKLDAGLYSDFALLAKPFGISHLLTMVRAILEGQDPSASA